MRTNLDVCSGKIAEIAAHRDPTSAGRRGDEVSPSANWRARFAAVAVATLFAVTSITTASATPRNRINPVPDGNPFKGCLLQSSTDGQFGFVWKPSGAHTPYAVIVLPSRYVEQTSSVALYTLDKSFIENPFMKSTGVCVPGLECLKRPTFKCNKTGAGYRKAYKSVVIRVKTKIGHCFLYKIVNPGLRSD